MFETVGKSTCKPITRFPERCLNQRHHEAGCQYCVSVCPVGAIQSSGADISVDMDGCVGCGLCLHACPVEVFTGGESSEQWREAALLDTLPAAQGASLEVVCGVFPDHNHINQARRQRVPVCLAALSAGAWFELSAEQQVTARLDACRSCPLGLGGVVPQIEQMIHSAREWLDSCGRAGHLQICDTVIPPEQVNQTAASAASNRQPDSRRRAFLSTMFKLGLTSVFGAALGFGDVKSPSSATKTQPERFAAKHLPRWLERFAQVYERLHDEHDGAAHWSSVQIDSKCVVCAACGDYCPTGALRIDSSSDFDIVVTPGTCIGCGLCVRACPTHAVTLTEIAHATPFQPELVYHTSVMPCLRCGQPAQAGTMGLCFWCAEEPPMDSLMNDAKRWLLTPPSPPR